MSGSYVVPSTLRYRFWAVALLFGCVWTILVVGQGFRQGWSFLHTAALGVIVTLVTLLSVQSWRVGPRILDRVAWDESGLAVRPHRGGPFRVTWDEIRAVSIPVYKETHVIAYGRWAGLSIRGRPGNYFVMLADSADCEALLLALESKTRVVIGGRTVSGDGADRGGGRNAL